MSKSPRKRVFQRGQSIVEYVLIILLVALTAIGALVLLTPFIQHTFAAVTSSL